MINSSTGLVPLSDFVNFAPIKKIERLDRINGNRVFIIDANVEDGYLVNDKIKEAKNWINKNADLQTVSFNFEVESEDQEETQIFLSNAFILAIVLMVFILICQFFCKTFVMIRCLYPINIIVNEI